MRRTVMADRGPAPAGPYSHAVVANGFVYLSGQGPVDPDTGTIPDGFADQVRQTLKNVQTILEAAGSSLDGVVKVNAYVTDLTQFAECRGFEVAILLDELGPRPPEIAGAEPRSIVARGRSLPDCLQRAGVPSPRSARRLRFLCHSGSDSPLRRRRIAALPSKG